MDIDSISVLKLICLIFLIRVVFVLYRTAKPFRSPPSKNLRTLVILGSGGHTAEMLSILRVLQMDRFVPRFYVAALTDDMSLQKARTFEESLIQQGEVDTRQIMKSAQFMQIYRSREVGQSYLTSVITTLIAVAHAFWLMINIRPQVIICNGPGTCIPLCFAAFAFKVIGIEWCSIFYVESIARVRKLSLSGLLLYKLRLVDKLFVQWPQLQSKYPNADYFGRIM